MKNPELVPHAKITRVEFLLLISRTAYGVRLTTSNRIHLARAGEWEIFLRTEELDLSLSAGRVLDPQNREFVTRMLSFRPVRIVLPFGHPAFVSRQGPFPRYYIPLPRACSLVFESANP